MLKFNKKLLFVFPSMAFATSLSLPNVLTLSGGPQWTIPGQGQQIYLDNVGSNYYKNMSSLQTVGTGELFVGYTKPISWINMQWGGLISGSGVAKVKGEIWQLNDPDFNNLSYSYKVNQFKVGLRTKWMPNRSFRWGYLPYVTGSVGVGFNRSFSFTNNILISSAVQNPNFQDNTLTSFTYSIGAGFQKSITSKIDVGLGYEMYDWGPSGLGTAPGQTLNTGLKMNHLYAHTLLASVIYHMDAHDSKKRKYDHAYNQAYPQIIRNSTNQKTSQQVLADKIYQLSREILKHNYKIRFTYHTEHGEKVDARIFYKHAMRAGFQPKNIQVVINGHDYAYQA